MPYSGYAWQKNNVCKWKAKHITQLLRNKRKLFISYKKSGLDKTSAQWESYRQARNAATSAIKSAKASFYKNIVDNKDIGVWEKIKLVKGGKSQVNSIEKIIYNDVSYSTNVDIANSLNDYFSTIGSKLNRSAATVPVPVISNLSVYSHLSSPAVDGFVFSEVDVNLVAKKLHSLKNRKNGGVQQIPAFIYKALEPLILAPLTYVINLSLKSNQFSNCWKKALVLPLYKSGNKALPANYRPISLLPILSKLYEKILDQQIRGHIFSSELLSSRQFSFPAGCSTDQLVYQLYHLIKHKLSQRNSKFVSVAALDIKKSFRLC